MDTRLSILLLTSLIILEGCAPPGTIPATAPSQQADTVTIPTTQTAQADITPKIELAAAPDLQTDTPDAPAVLTGCEAAAADAEREKGLPPGLLTAIAGVESGMHATALRIGGRPIYPASKAQARLAARQALRRSQSVMAGCMQVNLQAHDPGGKLWALEPEHAANWAADYLSDLHDRLGSWRSALQVYGGGGGQRYVRRVERQLDSGLPDEVAEAP
jgi:hypothetical protein